MREPAFLTLDEALALHADQIGRYGGSPGVRDLGLLESALGAPRAPPGGIDRMSMGVARVARWVGVAAGLRTLPR